MWFVTSVLVFAAACTAACATWARCACQAVQLLTGMHEAHVTRMEALVVVDPSQLLQCLAAVTAAAAAQAAVDLPSSTLACHRRQQAHWQRQQQQQLVVAAA